LKEQVFEELLYVSKTDFGLLHLARDCDYKILTCPILGLVQGLAKPYHKTKGIESSYA